MKMPQIVLIVLFCLSLGISMAKHGQEETKKHNFFTSLVSVAIEVSILIWGGFF